MDLLYMPLLDLQQHLKQELLINPFLELSADEDEEEQAEDETPDTSTETPTATAEEPPAPEAEEQTDWEEILLNGFEAEGATREMREDREQFESVSVATEGLDDHLRQQIQLLD